MYPVVNLHPACFAESELVSRLPQWQAQIYFSLSRQQDLLGAEISAWIAEQTNLIAFETRFDDGEPSSTPDLSRMSPEQLDQYSAILTRNLALAGTIVNRAKIYDAADLAILEGVTSTDEIGQRILSQHPNLER